ncbi:MAG: hypothetical protein AB7K86_09450 [Rhodospirillales bacterium]
MADDLPPRARPFALALIAAFALTMAVAVLVPLWVTDRDVPAARR